LAFGSFLYVIIFQIIGQKMCVIITNTDNIITNTDNIITNTDNIITNNIKSTNELYYFRI
jgi:hypothetical protein